MEYFSTIERLKIAEIAITIFFCCLMILTIYIRRPLRYVASIPLGIIALYSILLTSIPSYTTGPNKQDFFQTQKNKIVIFSKIYAPEEYIQIKTNDTIQKIPIITGEQEQELLKEKTTLQYISPKTGTQTQIFFLSKNGGIVELLPQSSIEIQGLYPNHTEIKIQEGSVFSYIPEEEVSFFTIPNTKQQSEIKTLPLQETFEHNKQAYIQKQRGNPLFYDPTSIQIQQKILDLAYTLFPQIYTNKKQNFEEFRRAINLPILEKIDIRTDTSAATQEIFHQGTRGREETNLYKRIFNFF